MSDPVAWGEIRMVKDAVEKLDISTAKLSRRMIFLNVILVILTTILTVLTLILTFK